MRSLFTLFLLSSVCMFAQLPGNDQTPTAPVNNPADTTNESTMTSLAGQFFQHNFVNFYGLANAIYQTVPLVYGGGQSTGSFGYEVGGGVDLFHQFETGTVSLGYRGNYTGYSGAGYESGTNQSLVFVFSKRLSARWIFSVNTNAGVSLYGGQYYGPIASGGNTPITNPFSPETRFLSGSLALSYRQTRRLTYTVAGSFFLARYTGSYGIGATGGLGMISATYRLTARTSLSGSYAHDAFYYQHGAGSTDVDSVYLTLAHTFSNRIRVTASGGIAHAGGSGTALIPVKVVIDGQTVIINEPVTYKESGWVPSFQGSVYYKLGHFLLSANAGQSVSPGNGVFLASREIFLNGYVSRTWRRSNLSAGGGYIHILSVSNTIRSAVNGSYDSASFSASYGYHLRRFLSAQAGFSYFNNGSITSFGGVSESRVFVGLTFSSKGIPLTLF